MGGYTTGNTERLRLPLKMMVVLTRPSSKVLRRLALLARHDRNLVRLGRKQLRVDVWEHSTLRDDDVAEQTVELLVVADRELEVTGNDARLLVVTGGSEAGKRSFWIRNRQETNRAALPASSRISAARYSRTAAR